MKLLVLAASFCAGLAEYDASLGDCDCMTLKTGSTPTTAELVDSATQAAWSYSGWKNGDGTDGPPVTMHGACAVTPDWPDQPWCYIDRTKTCKFATESTVMKNSAGEKLHYRKCDPTACRGSWTWKAYGDNKEDIKYNGCAADPVWGAWCYTQGREPYAAMSTLSLNENENLHWKNCNPCACFNKWEYTQPDYTSKDANGQYDTDLAGESATMNTRCWKDEKYVVDGKAESWCYVEGFGNCKKDMRTGGASTKSQVKGEHRYFVLCGKETCGNHKNVYKNNECCGMPTKAWPLQMST